MRTDNNYRFCVRASLQVMHEMRQKLCDDNINHNPTIFCGLYEIGNNALRDVYFQSYLVEWLDLHWGEITAIINRHKEFSETQKKSLTLFFAEYFSKMISICDNGGTLSKLAIPDLLKTDKKALDEMIILSEKWEVSSNNVTAEAKKHKVQYKKLIESLKKEGTK